LQKDLVYLDEFLSEYPNPVDQKLRVYEAIIAGLLRKYIPIGNKVELNLYHSYKDTYLDVKLNDDGITKISWGEQK
jgi:hypothetical protein